MHFLEQIFNTSPDEGTGTTELALLVAIVLAIGIRWIFTAIYKAAPRIE